MHILGIETSCDETALALVTFTEHNGHTHYHIRNEKLHSQNDLHSGYGGVYPTLAKREHQKILPILTKSIIETLPTKPNKPSAETVKMVQDICNREPEMLSAIQTHFTKVRPIDIDTLAVTQGPGLAPALWVGVNFTRALSLLWDIPIIPINHMEGHIVSALISETELITPTYPLLALLVSGGHTELVLAQKEGVYQKIGQTLDDAAGEAFDKVARLLDLPYPGGPEIARLADSARKKGRRPTNRLPRPMLKEPSLNFSYAGLKTAVRVLYEKEQPNSEDEKERIALEFEQAVVETLIEKTRRAIEYHAPQTLILGGGVSANTCLRKEMRVLVKTYPETSLHIAKQAYATDNALMIALAAYRNRKKTVDAKTLAADARMSFPYDTV